MGRVEFVGGTVLNLSSGPGVSLNGLNCAHTLDFHLSDDVAVNSERCHQFVLLVIGDPGVGHILIIY